MFLHNKVVLEELKKINKDEKFEGCFENGISDEIVWIDSDLKAYFSEDLTEKQLSNILDAIESESFSYYLNKRTVSNLKDEFFNRKTGEKDPYFMIYKDRNGESFAKSYLSDLGSSAQQKLEQDLIENLINPTKFDIKITRIKKDGYLSRVDYSFKSEDSSVVLSRIERNSYLPLHNEFVNGLEFFVLNWGLKGETKVFNSKENLLKFSFENLNLKESINWIVCFNPNEELSTHVKLEWHKEISQFCLNKTYC